MGTNCALRLADIFLYSYEAHFIQYLPSTGKEQLAYRFNFTYRYIDDVFSINNPEFDNYLSQMYPAELEIKDTTDSTTSASYVDLQLFIGRNGQIHTSIHDKQDYFKLHITNFPFLSSYISSSPAYEVFISQLKRYARPCSSYECFILRARRLSSKLLKQGYLVECLKSSFRKFYGRNGDFIQQYQVPLSRMLNVFLTFDHQWLPNRSDKWSICDGCRMQAGNAYPSVQLVPSPFLGHKRQRLQCPALSGVRPSSVRLFTFSTSSPEPLDGFWWNLVWMKYLRSLKSVVVFRPDPSRGGSRAGQK